MCYSFLRPLLFQLEPETAHHLTLKSLSLVNKIGLSSLLRSTVACQPLTVMGLTFPNPVGLAAGLDKNGEYIDALAALGFGFIEVGTVTPRPQPGNPKPRLFRLIESQAIINRMGFNNAGVAQLIENVKRANYRGILGINIGKNFDTPIERAVDDYLLGLTQVYPYASYVTVNISSPNTQNLRQLQQASELGNLLSQLKTTQEKLAQTYSKYVPLAIKIAPDLEVSQLTEIADLLMQYKIDGVIATNTTLARDGVEREQFGKETGGLSGQPLTNKSTWVIRELAARFNGSVPIIGVGGILTGRDAKEKMVAGASLVQLYSGLIYRGPQLIKEVLRETGELASISSS